MSAPPEGQAQESPATTDNPAPATTAPATGATGKSHLPEIVRWAARAASIPAFALALYFVIPDLASFRVAAKDDRIIALGLCGVCLGILAAWRWASVGGAVILASVAAMLAQGESWLNPDPFSLAFALQGILFLASAVLGRPAAGAAAPRLSLARQAALAVLVLGALGGAAILCRGPGPVPLMRDKLVFVGAWENGAGFGLEINADGHAKVTRAANAKVEEWNSPVRPGETRVFQADIRADDTLQLSRGFFTDPKIYLIQQHPHQEGKDVKMVLNGSTGTQHGPGVTLVKHPAP